MNRSSSHLAYVVRFESESRSSGWVEQVSSGRRGYFLSAAELMAMLIRGFDDIDQFADPSSAVASSARRTRSSEP